MNHAKTSFSTEICAGAIISVVQYLAPLRYFGSGPCPFECRRNTFQRALFGSVATLRGGSYCSAMCIGTEDRSMGALTVHVYEAEMAAK
jgi:hypothetical protein